jgi:hypothetical protein
MPYRLLFVLIELLCAVMWHERFIVIGGPETMSPLAACWTKLRAKRKDSVPNIQLRKAAVSYTTHMHAEEGQALPVTNAVCI